MPNTKARCDICGITLLSYTNENFERHANNGSPITSGKVCGLCANWVKMARFGVKIVEVDMSGWNFIQHDKMHKYSDAREKRIKNFFENLAFKELKK